MSDKNKDINKLDLTSDMTDDWDSELNEDELTNPDSVESNHDDIHGSSDDEDINKANINDDDIDDDIDDDDIDDDNDIDDDEEDESESTSILSTKSGKILVGASVFGAGILSLGGYVVFSSLFGSSPSVPDVPEATTKIKPIYEDTIVASTDSFQETEVKSNSLENSLQDKESKNIALAEKPEDVTSENTDLQINFKETKPEIKGDSNNVALAENKDIVLYFNKNDNVVSLEDTPQQPEIKLANTNEEQKRFDLSLIPVQEKSNVEEKAGTISIDSHNAILASTKINEKLESKITSLEETTLSKLEADKFIKEIVKAESADEVEKIKSLEIKVDTLAKMLSERKKEDQLTIAQLKESKKSEKVNKESLVDASKLGRERLKGFKIINVTMDGKMSVVKAPSGRTIILYKGEGFYTKDKGSFVVNEVLNDGNLLLANKNHYIDNVYEEPIYSEPVAKKAVKKVLDKKPVVLLDNNSENIVVSALNNKSSKMINVAKLADNIKINSTKEVAKGFTWNGQMGNEFIIQMPNGEWEIIKQGDEIEGLGLVNGLSDAENLIVGEFVIEKSKD